MDQTIKIQAEVLQHDRASCRFTVDRTVYSGGFIRFRNQEQAQGSPLAERLFAIDGVRAVSLQGQEVVVTHDAPVDWKAVGPAIGAALRAHLQSGQAPVSEAAAQQAPAEDRLRQKIQKILDEQINPAIASHGGLISILDVQGNKLFLEMGGGCQGCGAADVTLRQGVEATLREHIPELGEIYDTTDHTAGTNPYY